VRTAVARDNLTQAFPSLDQRRIRQIAHGCYRHFGALMAEFARLPRLSRKNLFDLVDLEGLNVLDAARAAGRGGIVVSGHFGNWELMGASVAVLGYPVSYVVTRQENELVERQMDHLRRRASIDLIKRRDATKGVLKALRENRLVAILSDQDAHEAGAFVPFFGRVASTPRGAAIFALRTGAALIFAESYRQGRGKLKIILELIRMNDLSADHGEAVHELVRRFTARLEEAVRQHPEQWFWMHRRWKTKPPENMPFSSEGNL
ncbi:MAG TPA: lysophospholipid acyltransferase family protein, partial [bacterium]